MHEMALAEGVLATALGLAREREQPVVKIIVKIGQLQQISTETFRDCLDLFRPKDEPLLSQARIQLDTEPATLTCRACSHAYGLGDLPGKPGESELEAIHFIPELAHSYLRCPRCASPDFDVTKGRGVWIEAIEVEESP